MTSGGDERSDRPTSERSDDLCPSDWSVRFVVEAGPVLIALAHPDRFTLLRTLHRVQSQSGGDDDVERPGGAGMRIGALATVAEISRWAAWRQLRFLRRAGLVVTEIEGSGRMYRLCLPASPRVMQWLVPLLSAP